MKFIFGKYPKWEARKTDHRDALVRGIARQLSFLNSDRDSDLNPKDRAHWYRVVDGVYYCWLYVSNVALDLHGTGEPIAPIIAETRDEAKQVYEQLLEQVEAGKYDDLIKKHLAGIPPRKHKAVVEGNTQGGDND